MGGPGKESPASTESSAKLETHSVPRSALLFGFHQRRAACRVQEQRVWFLSLTQDWNLETVVGGLV